LLILVILAGLIGFGVMAWRPAIDAISPPAASSFAPDLVARGQVLAGAGNCASCHSAAGGQPYAGGVPIRTPFGVIYSTNITPEPTTGIGTWSQAAFRRALKEGVARDGSHLFPAFPYDHFTKLTDEDIAALYAYCMTRMPVDAPAKRNGIPFPLNIRALQAGWKLLFFHPGQFESTPARGADWNRGAYLAEGVSHCGACHTPRNALGAERTGEAYGGALIEGWSAPPLTQDNPAPAPWSAEELYAYLRSGVSAYHGTAVGPMAEVVQKDLATLPDADIRAIAGYFATLDDATARAASTAPALARAVAANQLRDNALYTAACASCHYNGAAGPNPLRPDLGLNSAVHLDDPANLIRVMLNGVDAEQGAPGVVMPAFSGLSDAELAAIAAYLRSTRTTRAPWQDLERTVAAVRAQSAAQ
jgi:mono/diheme cytochrome c family protein